MSDNTGSLPSHADRKFYDLPIIDKKQEPDGDQPDGLLSYIERSVIGKDKVFSGPYGLRKVVYCDYTASGRSLSFIEDFIREQVLEDYGNTHTTTTVTSLQTTLFRHEARDIVRNAVNASEHDAVIFVGSGCTGAVHKLIHALHLQDPPVVFVSPYEHHSNLLPWRDMGCDVVQVEQTVDGAVNMDHLDYLLQCYSTSTRQLIGCFAAASNVTGTMVDADAVTECLHKHGALAFWDYATAAPYVNIDMNPLTKSGKMSLAKDAVFISTHKFIGGVQTPGILVAKKKLFRNPVPYESGGGSVFYVRRESHRYLQEAEMREEAGTPAIVEAIRAGLVVQLKQAVGTVTIMNREEQLVRSAHDSWSKCAQLVLLGSSSLPKLPIFSFLVKHPESGRFLHHNFVCALLNDVFGVQARGGCACAGPYAQDLLGIDEELAAQFEEVLAEDSRLDRVHLRRYAEYSCHEMVRPGFTRLNLPYFMSDEDAEFVISAVAMVAEHGWKLLPQYNFNPETGEWRQRHHQVFRDRKWLGHVTYKSGEMMYRQPRLVNKGGPCPANHSQCLEEAKTLFEQAEKMNIQLSDQTTLFSDWKIQPLRWFLLPSEAYGYLHKTIKPSTPAPKACFTPPSYPLQKPRKDWTKEPKTYMFMEGVAKVQMRKLVKFAEEESRRSREPVIIEKEEVKALKSILKKSKFNDDEKGKGYFVNSEKSKKMPFQAKAKPASYKWDHDRKEIGNTEHKILKPIPVPKEAPDLEELKKVDVENAAVVVKRKNTDEDFANLSGSVEEEVDIWRMMANMPIAAAPPKKRVVKKVDKPKSDIVVKKDESGLSFRKGLAGEISQGFVSTNGENSGAVAEVDIGEGGEVVKIGANSTVEIEKNSKIVSENKAVAKSKHLKENDTEENGAEPASKRLKCEDGACFQKREVKPEVSTPAVAVGHKWFAPPKVIFKPMCEAINDYSMLTTGDKVLVCLSGGKDSLSLLHALHQYQFYSRSKGVNFDLGAMTVDPQTSAYDPSPLKPYLAELGVPYFYEEQNILESAGSLPYEVASICSFCSRLKRGRIYHTARREGYNVLALGQHLDDLAESFLMSVFHNGILRTMKASYAVQEGDLRVIRPFVYVREKDLRQFAEQKKLPVISENCPACFEAPKERHRMKQLLAAQEVLHPRLFPSVMAAIRPIMGINRTGVDMKKLLAELNRGEEEEDGVVAGEGAVGVKDGEEDTEGIGAREGTDGVKEGANSGKQGEGQVKVKEGNTEANNKMLQKDLDINKDGNVKSEESMEVEINEKSK